MGFAYVDDAMPIPKAEGATFVTTKYECKLIILEAQRKVY